MADGDDHNRPKRRIWRRLGPRCVFIYFLSCFYGLTNFFFVLLRFYLRSTSMGGFGWVETTKTGPNDVRRVVWALGVCFLNINVFIIFIFVLLL